ncbi:MAG: 50S ribosomal protein L25 [Gemmatimonas sp.]|nr:50S ribosomal protein L25 [Gemmatimonas sp.]
MATLAARPREESGKSVARRLRREGRIPAVAYGHGEATRSLTVDAQELEKLLSNINAETTIIDLEVEGVRLPVSALIREIQHHPSRPIILHVDFFQIRAGKKLHVEVPIRLHGTPIGVRESGGVLQEVLREITVECLPKDIPQGVDIDVDDLELGGTVHVSDISIPSGTILNDPELVICSVSVPMVAALPEEEEAQVGAEMQLELVGEGEAAKEAGEGSAE